MSNAAPPPTKNQARATWLIGLGALSLLGYAVLTWLSGQFADDVPAVNRPTLWMLVLFALQFVLYGCSLWLAIRLPPTKWLVGGIFAGACLFRAVLLPSTPMHEIDLYRYIWDGAVLANGVSPYRYTPQQVINAAKNPADTTDPTLRQLFELQDSSNSLQECLDGIHFENFPSPYPLVSQAVFALSAQLTRDTATRDTRLLIIKAMLVLFDVATLLVVMMLVRATGLHPGWSLVYGWCPLLMKEVANGGHLDSIAIFFTTLAVGLLVRTWQSVSLNRSLCAALSGSVLALAIGAKLYPLVLVPLFVAVWLRRSGWIALIAGTFSTALVSAALLYPLFGPASHGKTSAAVDADAGIQAFLKHWEMNDLIFMVVVDNLRPQGDVEPGKRPWFVVTTDNLSRTFVSRWSTWKQQWIAPELLTEMPGEPLTVKQLKAESFVLARCITGGLFGLLACWFAWRAAGQVDPQAWCRAGMLTLAWFWLTCPTQNPWYWCWVVPLLPFARYRTWLVVAAVTMLYYLRFWLNAHYAETTVAGTPYNGEYFFYFVLAWIEFVPVLLALSVEWLLGRSEK